jgi:hypothetical protein
MTDERKPDEGTAQREREELAAYKKLGQEVSRLLGEIRGNVNAEDFRQAVEEAGNRLKQLGGHTAEALKKAAEALRKDVAGTAQQFGPKWGAYTEKASGIFAVWRDRGTSFLGQAAIAVGEWLQKTGEKMEQQTYQAGEMTYGGTFECTACGQQLVLAQPGHLPPCRNCLKTEFRRVRAAPGAGGTQPGE